MKNLNKKNNIKKKNVLHNQVVSLILITLPREALIEFINLWPVEQWVTSLMGLVLMYWWATKFYNKRLQKYDLSMTVAIRFWMIFSDLAINLALGLYYLGYRETVMGQLMIKCPIAVSPVIFLIEFILLDFYYWRALSLRSK